MDGTPDRTATPSESDRFSRHQRRRVTDCTYCGCEVEAHDPVFVSETSGGDGTEDDGERVSAGRFCNYACLSAHVEESGLADGARCRLDV